MTTTARDGSPHRGSPRAAFTREESEKLYAARLFAAEARPYLATALYALKPILSWTVPTMAVDRYWRCYVSPAFVAATPVDELAGVWVHEVSHLLRDHHGRGERLATEKDLTGPGHRLRMNIAADFEINDDVYGDGLPRPAGVIGPELLGLATGKLMEEYLPMIAMGVYSRQLVWLDCGGGADGSDRPWELGPDGAHGLDEQTRALVRYRVAQGLIGRGDAPGGWQRWAEKVVHPPQPWRELLGNAIRSAVSAPGVGEDYVYHRPSRRSSSLPGVILPSLRRRPPRVSVVIDTSGSVSDTELGSALLEVAAITRAVGGRRDLVRVVSCDAAAHVTGEICKSEGIPLLGGGGTDMREGFTKALSTRPAPDVIVVLTDGQTPWPQRQPPCRTVIGLFPRPRFVDENDPDFELDLPPSWARVVTLG
ncbi:vWA domain-containing protein [Actinoplanes xinjiangensis]|uniref:vWA domain-containing protein n=1 Tax=Actinoplanes xinjiangensis TaxID=512350 RepID=UPI003431D94F